jgi:hypothetical protein
MLKWPVIERLLSTPLREDEWHRIVWCWLSISGLENF